MTTRTKPKPIQRLSRIPTSPPLADLLDAVPDNAAPKPVEPGNVNVVKDQHTDILDASRRAESGATHFVNKDTSNPDTARPQPEAGEAFSASSAPQKADITPRRSAPKKGDSPFQRTNVMLGKGTLEVIASITNNRSEFLDIAAWEKIERDHPLEFDQARRSGIVPTVK